MAYTNKQKSEILASIKKIGVAKSARLYGISRVTIHSWLKNDDKILKNNTDIKEKIAKQNSRIKEISFRRTYIVNDKFRYYIYNIKDLNTNFEYFGYSFYSNHNTPVRFLKYIFSIFSLNKNISKFLVLIKEEALQKKIDELQENSHFSFSLKTKLIDKLDKYESIKIKDLTNLRDKAKIAEYLYESQLCFNVSISMHQNDDFRFILPLNFDYTHPVTEKDNFLNKSLLNSIVERILLKISCLHKKADYSNAQKYLNIVESIMQKFKDKDIFLEFLESQTSLFLTQGDKNKALDFLKKQYLGRRYIDKTIKIYLLLMICEIYLENDDVKKYDYYFKKIKITDNDSLPVDLNFDYNFLKVFREIFLSPHKELADKLKQLAFKSQKKISEKKFFKALGKLVNIYQMIDDYTETKILLKTISDLPLVKEDEYNLCYFYLAKIIYYRNIGCMEESEETRVKLEKIALNSEYNYFVAESRYLKGLVYLESGNYEEVKQLADQILSFGNLKKINLIINKACILYQRLFMR